MATHLVLEWSENGNLPVEIVLVLMLAFEGFCVEGCGYWTEVLNCPWVTWMVMEKAVVTTNSKMVEEWSYLTADLVFDTSLCLIFLVIIRETILREEIGSSVWESSECFGGFLLGFGFFIYLPFSDSLVVVHLIPRLPLHPHHTLLTYCMLLCLWNSSNMRDQMNNNQKKVSESLDA